MAFAHRGSFLGYFSYANREGESTFPKELSGDRDFFVDSKPSDEMTFAERASSRKFYLFEYEGDLSRIREVLGFRCVPMVLIDRLI